MATTIHLQDDLLRHLDARAKTLKLSRSKLIAKLVRRGLEEDTDWPEALLEVLSELQNPSRYQNPFSPTKLEDVAGCLAFEGQAKSIGDMDLAIKNAVRASWSA